VDGQEVLSYRQVEGVPSVVKLINIFAEGTT